MNLAALKENGYLHYKEALSSKEVSWLKEIIDQTCSTQLKRRKFTSNYLPILTNSDQSEIQRFPFINKANSQLKELLQLSSIQNILAPFQNEFMIGWEENDGLIYTKYQSNPSQYHKLGWHMDGGKSWLKGRKIIDFYNIGIHFSNCPQEKGGLRFLEKSHNNYPLYNVLIKPSFVDHRTDKQEKIIETKVGDVTIHHSNILHRVAASKVPNNTREVLYFSLIPKNHQSHFRTNEKPLYWKMFQWLKNK